MDGVTESTSTDTDGQPTDAPVIKRKRRLELGTWTELSAVVVALLAIVVTVFGIKFYNDSNNKDDTPAPATAGATTPATVPTADPTIEPTAASGRFLAEVTRIGGVPAELPDDLDPAKFPHAIVAECPSNQTGQTARSLTYDLDRRYRTFTATVTGWADTKDPDAILVRVSTRTKQIDDTFITTQQATVGGVVNGAPVALTAKVKDANEIVLEIECHRPKGFVILSEAQVHN